jgi:hypothetical protein
MFAFLYKFLFRYFAFARVVYDTQCIVKFFGKDSRFVQYMRHNNDLSYTDEQDNIVYSRYGDQPFRIKDLTFQGNSVYYKNSLIFNVLVFPSSPNRASILMSSDFVSCENQEIYDLFSDIDIIKKLHGNIDLSDNISEILILDEGFVQNGDHVVKCEQIEIHSPDLDLHNFHADIVVLECEYDITSLGKLPLELQFAPAYRSENVSSYLDVPMINMNGFKSNLVSLIPGENDIQQILVDQMLIFNCLALKNGNETLYFNINHPLFERYRNNEMKIKSSCKRARTNEILVDNRYLTNRYICQGPICRVRPNAC